MPRRGFTLIELLVVIAVIALLIGLLLPALGAARKHAKLAVCGSRLQQIGVGITVYTGDYRDHLPQAKGPLPMGGEAVIGALFAGQKGQLPYYGIDSIGAERRPLNRYVDDRIVAPDSEPGIVPMEALRSPLDKGCEETGVPFPPGFERTDSMYEFIGSSYTLNDHALEGEQAATLVPLGGGKMPEVFDTTKTWVVGTHPIYNYQQGGDRGMRWYDTNKVEANLLYADGHTRTRVPVPEGVVNTTPDYTFLPRGN
jgi:prepilin-type N-terminal cleavage/methylation domain-containing protein/prepilin-type processing-associated H-X9-DG protein